MDMFERAISRIEARIEGCKQADEIITRICGEGQNTPANIARMEAFEAVLQDLLVIKEKYGKENV